MSTIRLETRIHAPPPRVFDLARSIDAHIASTSPTGERAVAGRTSGLIEMGEHVTWEARHFGIRQRLTVQITAYNRPHLFEDVMVRGTFKHMRHTHRFTEHGDGTLMTDEFTFTAPLGLLGRLADRLFLTRYMRAFLIQRNSILKQTAESNQWKNFLPEPAEHPDPLS